MFDLERAIKAWRQQMITAGIKTPAPLDELESHLRDAVAQQRRLGLNEAQAFAEASHQMGHAAQINSEFEKVSLPKAPWGQKWGDRYALWIVACCNGLYFAVWTRVLLLYPLFNGSERAWGFIGLAATPLAVFIGLAATPLAVFAGWLLIPRGWPNIRNQRLESALVSLCVVSGAAWFVFFARYVLPHLEITPGEFRVAIIWAAIPTMVTPAFFLSLRKREYSESSANPF